ncbi:MAG: DUF1572 family protein [Saprospiraceae bacterium]
MNTLKNIQYEIKRRILIEGLERIKTCLNLVSYNQIWWKPNDNSNAIGNLILHLNGNVRQWLITTLNEDKDTRQRELEFLPNRQFTKRELLSIVNTLALDLEEVIPKISLEKLEKVYNVQGYKETLLSIIFHVIEHFSYHVGQITYITKMILDIDTRYYKGQNLGNKNDN